MNQIYTNWTCLIYATCNNMCVTMQIWKAGGLFYPLPIWFWNTCNVQYVQYWIIIWRRKNPPQEKIFTKIKFRQKYKNFAKRKNTSKKEVLHFSSSTDELRCFALISGVRWCDNIWHSWSNSCPLADINRAISCQHQQRHSMWLVDFDARVANEGAAVTMGTQ